MRTRIKICGITRLDDALAAVDAGADAIGFVFDPNSPRALSATTAAEISRQLPAFVSVVALFVDAAETQVRDVLGRVRVHLLQFHGHETPEQCRVYQVPYMKAVRMRDGVDLPAQASAYHDAAALLLDTHVPNVPGGTGQTFDWSRIPGALSRPIVLAGGLTPENVGEAVRRVRPYAVDVSSGVERSKGIKDHDKIRAFVRAVREAA